MKRILVTGGNGRFAKALKKLKSPNIFIYTDKKQLDINKVKSIKNAIKKYNPDVILHLAGLSRPLKQHEQNITRSISLNIIGTSNLVNACIDNNLKIIYFSTSYVYQGTRGNYKEDDPILPWSNYAWSKLGGESAVQMYKNSLILRVCMTERPFIHRSAFINVKSNFIFHDELAAIFLRLINKKGTINIGGKSQSIYHFAKEYKLKINKKFAKNEMPFNQSMNLNKMKNLLKK